MTKNTKIVMENVLNKFFPHLKVEDVFVPTLVDLVCGREPDKKGFILSVQDDVLIDEDILYEISADPRLKPFAFINIAVREDDDGSLRLRAIKVSDLYVGDLYGCETKDTEEMEELKDVKTLTAEGWEKYDGDGVWHLDIGLDVKGVVETVVETVLTAAERKSLFPVPYEDSDELRGFVLKLIGKEAPFKKSFMSFIENEKEKSEMSRMLDESHEKYVVHLMEYFKNSEGGAKKGDASALYLYNEEANNQSSCGTECACDKCEHNVALKDC